MNKSLAFMFVLFIGACANSVNKTEFANPVFNQPLRPLSRSTGYTYLTPTSIDMRTPKDKNLVAGKGECELIENTQESIILKCQYKWVPQKGVLETAQKNLQSSDPIIREIAQKTLEIHATTYEKNYTYKIDKLHFASCLAIEETIYEKIQTRMDINSTSYYCVTPPDDYQSKSD